MIRKLMASSALAALLSAGAWSAQAANQAATPQPAVAQPADTQATGANTTTGEATPTLTPDQPTLATAFIGRSVYSGEGNEADNIGDVNDLIINSNGTIAQAVVGVGGFLGIGEKNVAVPFNQLKVVERDGDIRLIYSATKEQLQNAQAFDRTAYDPRARDAKNRAASTDNNAGLAPAANTMAATGAAVGNAMNSVVADTNNAANNTAGNGANSGGGFVSFNPDQMRASTIMGQQIYGPDDKDIGKVADFVMQEDGKTRAALVDVGGFLGIGSKRVAIPFSEIKIAPDSQNANQPRLNVSLTREQLDQAPAWQDHTVGSDATTTAASNNAAGAMTPDATGAGAGGAMNSTGATAGGAGATGAMATDQTAANNAAAQPAAPQLTPVTQDVSVSNLIGSAVYGSNDKSLGTIGDVIMDATGQIQAVVVDVGGFLGIGQKPVAMQFDQMQMRKDENGALHLMMNATQEQLQNAPAYQAQASNG